MRRPPVRGLLRGGAALCGLAIAALAVATVLALAHEEQAEASARTAGPLVVALVDGSPAGPVRGALEHRLDRLGAVAPRWAELRPDGLLEARMPDARLRALRARGAGLLPVLHGGDAAVRAVLAAPALRNRVAIRTARSLDALGATGVVLDLDGVPGERRADLVALAQTLARLIGPGRSLVVAVPPATDADPGPQAGYDLRALSRSALVLVETAPADTTRGPVVQAPLERWREVVRRSAHEAPARRLLFALPTAGIAWEAGGVRAASQAELYPRLTEAHQQLPDGAARGTASDGWATETDRSIELKLRVVHDAGAAGVALPLAGGESTRLWSQPVISPDAG